jgi:hypothetical protein
MRIRATSDSEFVVMDVLTKLGLTKTYKFHYVSEDALQARSETDTYPVHIKYDATAMNHCLVNFPPSTTEITFALESRKISGSGRPVLSPVSSTAPQTQLSQSNVESVLKVKSYLNPGKVDLRNLLMTQLSIDSSSFDYFDSKFTLPEQSPPASNDHTPPSADNNTSGTGARSRSTQVSQPQYIQQCDMTFNLKDFKSFLTFCEAAEQSSVSIFMDHQGKPIILKSSAEKNNNDVEAICVLATLNPDSESSTQQSATPPSQRSSSSNTSSPITTFTHPNSGSPARSSSNGSGGGRGSRNTSNRSRASSSSPQQSPRRGGSTSSDPEVDAYYIEMPNRDQTPPGPTPSPQQEQHEEEDHHVSPSPSPSKKRGRHVPQEDEEEDDDRVEEEQEEEEYGEPQQKKQRFDDEDE